MRNDKKWQRKDSIHTELRCNIDPDILKRYTQQQWGEEKGEGNGPIDTLVGMSMRKHSSKMTKSKTMGPFSGRETTSTVFEE